MEVTIHRCSNKNYWYQKHIGSTFEVEDSHPDVTRYKVIGQDKTIDLEDTLEFNDYQSVLQRRDFEMTPSEEIYLVLRDFLQEHNAPPILKQKLYIMYENASFFD
jgi:hypothetical protein